MTESFPRILFCTWEIPQSVYAGSMQLYRVMQGYPGDRLMVLGNAPAPGAQLLPCRYEPLNLLTHRLACTRFGGWATGLNSLDLFPEPGLGASVELTRDFKPDLVVTVMDKLSYYKHAWALSRRLGAGLVTITMDDPQVFEPAVPSLEPAYTRFLGRMYGDAVLSLGVSQEMCEYLSRKFGRQSSVFYFGAGCTSNAASRSASEAAIVGTNPATVELSRAFQPTMKEAEVTRAPSAAGGSGSAHRPSTASSGPSPNLRGCLDKGACCVQESTMVAHPNVGQPARTHAR